MYDDSFDARNTAKSATSLVVPGRLRRVFWKNLLKLLIRLSRVYGYADEDANEDEPAADYDSAAAAGY